MTLRRFYETVRHFDPKTGERADWRRCRICHRPGPHDRVSSDDRDRTLDRILEEADAIAARLAAELKLEDGFELVFDRTRLLRQENGPITDHESGPTTTHDTDEPSPIEPSEVTVDDPSS